MEASRPDDKTIAAQLANPSGELGIAVAQSMNQGNALLCELMYSKLGVQQGEFVLEIGFGNGKFFPQFVEAASGGFVAGIDRSPTMIEEASKLNKELIESGKLELKLASLQHIPYLDNYFDKICTANTIYFWPDPEHDIQEIKRVLKPGGMLAIGFRSKSAMESVNFTWEGFTFYEPEDVIMLLEQAGFNKVQSVRIDNPLPYYESFDAITVTGIKE